MSDETCLEDLLNLHLHNFEDEVQTLVDKATKELSMEKTLKEMEVTWAQMEFETEVHKRTGLALLKSSEELIETLEENQVCVCMRACVCVFVYVCICLCCVGVCV